MRPSDARGGYVMQLQNFSVNDGDGIRTNLFLAGCPLRCAWCCNPEGQTQDNPLVRYMTTEEILRAVEKQMAFYRFSGGGVTFSGGEATMQPEFLRALCSALYDRGVSLALESCGWFDFAAVRDILMQMDLIFMDIKHMRDETHRFFTGRDVAPILQNIRATCALGVPLVIRVPVIKGVNATKRNLTETFAFVREELPGAKVELLPYHTYGEKKYETLGLPKPRANFTTPTPEDMAAYADMARAAGVEVVSYR